MSTVTIKVLAGYDRKRTDNNMELTSIPADSTPFLNEEASNSSSLRSSLDNNYYQSQGCDIHIYDDISLDPNTAPSSPNRGFVAAGWHGGDGNCEGFMQHLKVARLRTRCEILGSLSSGQGSTQDSMDVGILALIDTKVQRLRQPQQRGGMV